MIRATILNWPALSARSRLSCLPLIGALGALGTAGVDAASADRDNTTISVNYVYAGQLGIGSYEIGGLSVDVFTLPLAVTRSLGGAPGPRATERDVEDWQIRYKFPVSLGLFDFETFDPEFGHIDIDQKTLSLVPGIELVVPLNRYWRLKPVVDLGVGYVASSKGRGAGDNDFFLLYSGGLRSLVELPRGDYTIAIGNGLLFAGNQTFGGDEKENYLAIETGLQVSRPLGFSLKDLGVSKPGLANVRPQLGLYVVQYHYPDPLVFTRFREKPLKVRNQLELGIALGSATAWDLFSIHEPQIGMSYIFGDDLEVFKINFGFPF